MANLFNAGHLGIMANVGTLVGPITRTQYLNNSAAKPPQLFSHNDQQVQWQTSVPDKPTRTGWGGRCADLLDATYNDQSTPKVSMSISLAGVNTWEVGGTVTEYTMGTSGPSNLNIADGGQVQALRDIISLNHSNLYERQFGKTTQNALDAYSKITNALNGAPALDTSFFPNTSLANQLKMIAKLINVRSALGHNRQIYFASVSGYDLHGDQLAPHAALFSDLSKALDAFYTCTTNMGVQNNVTTFTVSDFGRTFPVNGGNGSDHGWGSHQIMMGGAVKGQQIYGTFPTLVVNGPDDTGLGRWIPTSAVDEYSATLAKWFGVSDTDIATIFPNIGRFARRDIGFMNNA